MITNCIVCKSKLIPMVYGKLNPELLDMQDKGLIMIGSKSTRGINSFCPLCEEGYGDYTDAPLFS